MTTRPILLTQSEIDHVLSEGEITLRRCTRPSPGRLIYGVPGDRLQIIWTSANTTKRSRLRKELKLLSGPDWRGKIYTPPWGELRFLRIVSAENNQIECVNTSPERKC